MATVSTNLTNLKNARLEIIKKIRSELKVDISDDTPLNKIKDYITGGNNEMVDFATFNKKSWVIWNSNYEKYLSYTKNKIPYITWTVPNDCFMTYSQFAQGAAGCFYRLLVKGKNAEPLSTLAQSSKLTNNWDSFGDLLQNSGWCRLCGNAVGNNYWEGAESTFQSWVKAGNEFIMTWNKNAFVESTSIHIWYFTKP